MLISVRFSQYLLLRSFSFMTPFGFYLMITIKIYIPNFQYRGQFMISYTSYTNI